MLWKVVRIAVVVCVCAVITPAVASQSLHGTGATRQRHAIAKRD